MKRKKVTGTELLIVLLISVILSNGEIAKSFSPFTAAFASTLGGVGLAASLVGTVIGFAFFGKITASLNYVAVILFLCAYEILSSSFKWKTPPMKKALITGSLMLVCDVLIAPWNGFEVARIISILINSLLCGAMSYYFNFLKTRLSPKFWIRPTKADYTALSIAFLSAITALASFDIWLFNAARIAGILAVALASRKSVSAAAVCGILVTAGIALGNYEYASSCTFITVSAIVLASLYEYGKIKSISVFLCVNFLSMLIIGIDVYTVGFFIDSLIGTAVSLFIKYSPEGINQGWSSTQYAYNKLLAAADAVGEVESSINKVANLLDKKTAKNTDWIYEKASGVVCRNCEKNMYCWQENYDRTVLAMNNAVRQYDKKTSLTTADLPDYLKTGCTKATEFTNELNGFYSSFLADSRATRKLLAERKIMLNQLELAKEMFVSVSDDLMSEDMGEKNKLDTEVKVLVKPASGSVSGDCYNAFCDADGNFYFCLFDGMGKGKRAAVDSNFLSKIVGELAETGLQMDTVMKTANDCMLVKSGDESFSTADILKINLKSGKAEIIKAGSAPTYFISKGEVTKIATKTFPLGMFTGTQSEKTVISTDVGDIFVLSSDGAGDISSFLENSTTTNTEILADGILNFVKKNNEAYKDDVCIAVIKLKKI